LLYRKTTDEAVEILRSLCATLQKEITQLKDDYAMQVNELMTAAELEQSELLNDNQRAQHQLESMEKGFKQELSQLKREHTKKIKVLMETIKSERKQQLHFQRQVEMLENKLEQEKTFAQSTINELERQLK